MLRRGGGVQRSSGVSMKLIAAVALCLSLSAVEAHAINRYTSTSMTCSRVKAIISQEGAAIMRYRSPRTGITLYDRYVKNRLFCQAGETTDRTYIPTSDVPSCPVDRCKEIEFFDSR